MVLVWIDLSEFLIQQKEYREAEAALRNALAVHDRITPSRPIRRATILHGMALTRLALGGREESIELLRQGIALVEGAAAVDEGATLPSINLLSSLYVLTGRMSDARATIQKATTIARRVEKNTHVANTWIVLSEIERATGNYDEARRAARIALKLIGPRNSDNSSRFEAAQNQLARIAHETANYGIAATHWKLTLDSLRERRPETDEEVLSLRVYIARIAISQGRLEEAEKELVAVTRLAEDHGRQTALAHGLYALGTLYIEQKQVDKASTVLVRSLAIADKQFGEMSAHSALCVGELARIYLKTRQPSEAAKFSSRAAGIVAGDDAVALVWLQVMQVHAQVLRKLNRRAEAKEVHQRASRLVSRQIRNQTIDVMDLTRQ